MSWSEEESQEKGKGNQGTLANVEHQMSLVFFFKYSVYLLGCARFQLQHTGSFVVTCKLLVAACGIQFPDLGLNSGLLYWEHGVLATGPPEKSQQMSFEDSKTWFWYTQAVWCSASHFTSLSLRFFICKKEMEGRNHAALSQLEITRIEGMTEKARLWLFAIVDVSHAVVSLPSAVKGVRKSRDLSKVLEVNTTYRRLSPSQSSSSPLN